MIIKDFCFIGPTWIEGTQIKVQLEDSIAAYEGDKVGHFPKANAGALWFVDMKHVHYIDHNQDERKLPITLIFTPVQASDKPRKKSLQEKAPLH